MSQQIAEIALMFILPLGITFTAILQSAAAETRTQKLAGVVLSVLIVAMDCIFYFAKNSFVTYNCDGGLLLTFASLLFLFVIYAIKSEDLATKTGNIFLSVFMFAGFLGIAYWDRPTFIPTSEYNPAEIAAMNAKYQDYIAAFARGEGGKILPAPKAEVKKKDHGNKSVIEGEAQLSRLEDYLVDAETVIKRMRDVVTSINEFEPLAANINEAERETRSRQALAINNTATALNRKVLGLFHPHESSEAHSELIKASESVRLAAYSLYNYTLVENPEEQQAQHEQAQKQISQMNAALNRFWKDIENLKSNNNNQTEEQ